MKEVTRGVRLYAMALTAGWHRLRDDLARELVVLVSSVVLLATFTYVFNDFLNVQVSSLSDAMRTRFAEVARGAVLLLTLATGIRLVQGEIHGAASLRAMARRLGETRHVERGYVAAKIITILAMLHGVAWWVVGRWIGPAPTGGAAVALEASLAAVTLLGGALMGPRKDEEGKELERTGHETVSEHLLARSTSSASGGAMSELVRWRLRQMLWRNRTTRLCFVLMVPFVGLAALAALRGAPAFVPAVAAFGAGYLASLALSFQGAEDLRYAWLERGLGVSHEAFIGAYERLSWLLSGVTFVTTALVIAGAGTIGGHAMLGDSSVTSAALKAGLVSTVPILVTPWLLLQIDGRRPALSALTTLIVALFVGTATLAHWLGALLLLLLKHFASQTQDKRFYRA